MEEVLHPQNHHYEFRGTTTSLEHCSLGNWKGSKYREEDSIYIRHYTYSTFLVYTVHISEVLSLCYKWQNECSLRYTTSNRARIQTQFCLLLSSLLFLGLFYCRLRYKTRPSLLTRRLSQGLTTQIRLGLTKMCTE